MERPEDGRDGLRPVRIGRDEARPSRLDLAEGTHPQPVDHVGTDLEHPVCQGDVYPVHRRAVLQPVLADGGAGRRGEVELLVRADARHHESALKILRCQRPRRVRRSDCGMDGSLDSVNGIVLRWRLRGFRRTNVPLRLVLWLPAAGFRPDYRLRHIGGATVAPL